LTISPVEDRAVKVKTWSKVIYTSLFSLATQIVGAQADSHALDAATASALDAAIAGEHRSEENKARDVYRRPRETLAYFGFRSDMTVVEIWPGAGWYTEILAPALKDHGTLYAAHYSLNPRYGYQRRYFGEFLGKLGANPDIYRGVIITALDVPYEIDIAPQGTADMVLTFRNAHNWVNPGYGAHTGAVTFKVMFDVLNPGGVLGVVDHRWPDPATEDPNADDGYVSEDRIIAMAEAAGFKLAGRSDMNRNEKDTHEHPQGVWTLPPSLALGDEDRDKYLAIGESDRMTLKFVKPAE
jgi:predicted methyltransferase